MVEDAQLQYVAKIKPLLADFEKGSFICCWQILKKDPLSVCRLIRP
jgi:hypothetical protein